MTVVIDLGTSGVKAALIEGAHRVRAVPTQHIFVSVPRVGGSEQDPEG